MRGKYHYADNNIKTYLFAFLQEYRWCDPEILLELASEVLGIFKAEAFSGFGDGSTTEQERLGALHDEAADVGSGRFARQFTDEVAEIVGGQEEFLGAIFHCRQSQCALGAIIVVMLQEVLEARQQVGVRGLGR